MDRAQLPLNALRAFEASARHLSFTRAGLELRVSQGAVSHQVAQLEDRLGTRLFRRLPRGLALTDDGLALVPVLAESFDRVGATLDQFSGGRFRETLTLGVVGTFAAGWLIDRLDSFGVTHPHIDLRLMTNNNRVDLAGDGLDLAIRFGDGAWHGTHAELLVETPLTAVCAAGVAARLAVPADLVRETLLRSYRPDEWPRWFDAAGIACPPLRGPIFDSSVLTAQAAARGLGAALIPAAMFVNELATGRLIRPFDLDIVTGSYWLTRLMSRRDTPAMAAFRRWIVGELA